MFCIKKSKQKGNKWLHKAVRTRNLSWDNNLQQIQWTWSSLEPTQHIIIYNGLISCFLPVTQWKDKPVDKLRIWLIFNQFNLTKRVALEWPRTFVLYFTSLHLLFYFISKQFLCTNRYTKSTTGFQGTFLSL